MLRQEEILVPTIQVSCAHDPPTLFLRLFQIGTFSFFRCFELSLRITILPHLHYVRQLGNVEEIDSTRLRFLVTKHEVHNKNASTNVYWRHCEKCTGDWKLVVPGFFHFHFICRNEDESTGLMTNRQTTQQSQQSSCRIVWLVISCQSNALVALQKFPPEIWRTVFRRPLYCPG